MKKITFLLVAFMATMLCACSSDDDSSNSLEGTTWVADEGDVEVFTLSFQKSTFKLTFVYDENLDGKPEETDTMSGTYSLDGSNVTLEGDGTKEYGSISGNKMTFSTDGDVVVYHKK